MEINTYAHDPSISLAAVANKKNASNPQNVHSILIIDDSNRICSLLVSGIVRQCAEIGYNFKIIQASELGLLETLPLYFGSEAANLDTQTNKYNPTFMIYTSDNPRNALKVLNLPSIINLTIISDVSMPADTEVGLVGMLDTIASLSLPVNLLFISSEIQNKEYVLTLIKSGKAYFIDKSHQAWPNLPFSLIKRHQDFDYKNIVSTDYDNGILRHQQVQTLLPVPPLSSTFFGRVKEWFKKLGHSA